ncbi:radical SAM protein [Candidatus Parcubacteria bacterium]|nr:radical SAM protein [Patescibacteria group bacterium]MBU4309836.1 radical SAM protein [Patescibacteria group bacterium]MBU4432082.1 radical SAM protein [Patescibacteria group bacterium]MBU4578175.1 radical SAM protein [Patescibacteria group bacterium]MCG2696712.1 radical SAM protein [Candidatus Parcubacteria bacterium]
MIFSGLLIKKYSDGKIKLINLADGDEALADQKALNLIISMSLKPSRVTCSEEEIALLVALEEGIAIFAEDGVSSPVISEGDFENLEISPTDSCNLLCRHCCVFDEDNPKRDHSIDINLLEKTIIDAEKMGMYSLRLSGGEILTYYAVERLLTFLNMRNVRTNIVTNGLLLDRFLSSMNNARMSFIISLDGFEASHDYLRGEGTFVRTKKNIEMAIDAGFEVEVNMVVYDKNVGDVDAFSEFVKDIGASSLNIQALRPVGRASHCLTGKMVTDEKFLRDIHQNELLSQMAKIEDGVTFCTSCKSGLIIDHDANVFGCVFLAEKPTGNLQKDSIATIYARAIAENPLHDLNTLSECSNCELFKKVCAGGCRARAYKMTGSIYGCDYWIPFLIGHPKFEKSGRRPHEFLLI